MGHAQKPAGSQFSLFFMWTCHGNLQERTENEKVIGLVNVKTDSRWSTASFRRRVKEIRVDEY